MNAHKKPLPGRLLPEPAPLRPAPKRPTYPGLKVGVRYFDRLISVPDLIAVHEQLDLIVTKEQDIDAPIPFILAELEEA